MNLTLFSFILGPLFAHLFKIAHFLSPHKIAILFHLLARNVKSNYFPLWCANQQLQHDWARRTFYWEILTSRKIINFRSDFFLGADKTKQTTAQQKLVKDWDGKHRWPSQTWVMKGNSSFKSTTVVHVNDGYIRHVNDSDSPLPSFTLPSFT